MIERLNNLWRRRLLTRARPRRLSERLRLQRRHLQWLVWARWGAVGLGVLSVMGVVIFVVAFAVFSRELPRPGEAIRREGFSSKIFDRHGTLIHDLYQDERRTPVQLDQVPEYLRQATVAVEDKDFYKHQGFDALTVLRIPYNLIVRQRVVGGSTLTQQLVKTVMLSNERTITRKIKELILALEMERTFTKDQILELYLNEAPYGGPAWGIGTAAEYYFRKPVSEVTLPEAVVLAGLPQRPSAYSPFTGKTDTDGTPLWQVRAKGVLRRMREDGYLTELAYTDAMASLPNITFNKGDTTIKAPHFVFYVRDQLEEIFGPEVVSQGGLNITTSLDLPLQDQAQLIVSEEIDKVAEKLKITNGAAMVMNPETGEVLAMVGSRGYNHPDIEGQFNVAVNGLRQPGSSIKPVVYLGMLQQGYTPATMLIDLPTTFARNAQEKPYEPKNYDGKFRGPVSLRNSLGSSLNVPAVKSIATVGISNILGLAYDLGFPTLEPSAENLRRLGLSVALGGGEVHLIDSTTAFSAFANGGQRIEPVAILKVVDRSGQTVYEYKPVGGKQVMKPEEAYLINHILSDNNARSIAFGLGSLLNLSPNVAVKTGTTNDQRDNWAIGWSSQLMVGAWVGNNDNSPMKTVASGVSGASPIWRRIFDYALKNGYAAPAWERPSGIEEVTVDAISGYASHDDFPMRTEQVIKGTFPNEPDPIHRKIKLCKGENKLATEAKIAAGDYDEKEFIILAEADPYSEDGRNRWQESINTWVAAQADERYKAPTEFCGEQTDLFVRLEKPGNETEWKEETIDVKITAGSGDGIDRLELFVDGNLRETVRSYQYEGKVTLSSGQHEIYAKAYTKGGKESRSDTSKIGTGGQPWKKPDPTATTAPTNTPAPTATPVAPTATPILPTLTPVLPVATATPTP